jgi:hypothetical protein
MFVLAHCTPYMKSAMPTDMPAETTMTTTQVMWALGYGSTKATNVWLRRRANAGQGIDPIYRYPGPYGENVYSREEVESAIRNRRGQGYRSDLHREQI